MLHNFIWFWMPLTSRTLHCQNISLSNVTQFYLVLDAVNQSYLALSKSAAKPTSCSLKMLASSTRLLPSGVRIRDNVQLPLHKTATHILIRNQQLPLSPGNSVLHFQLFCCCHVQDTWSSLPICSAETVPRLVTTVYCKSK